ncbi:sulfite exporter TauE/SafE family protein [Neptunomonas japonica]|uniref:Probable membrane transporter protein n=1 Tax=Neptunomonas japonica JAMM 1380 TaxID=1441457 RepID=A0A7R6SUC8_9GAMM|nr:sulfite exporter TauE/SafE family protein [Neptunomonas japonica]BBB28201.1 conserved hypothetical protein [Neptunomonas japonica JAMM 1380]
MTAWLPDGLNHLDLMILVSMSALTSMMTAAVGIGGGVLLLAIMAQMIPVQALIPVHGLVQLGSNGNRAYMTRQHIDWQMSRLFILGAVLGAAISVWIVVQLPLDMIRLCVAFFILFLVWGPKPKALLLSNSKLVLAGAVTTIISAFVGATGPLVAAFVHRQNMGKLPTVATFAACMSFQHLLKAVVFMSVGFVFQEWLLVVLLMIASGALGTWVGLHLLKSLSADVFKQLFRWVVTVLALRLCWQVFFSG